jgi:hypothetical protein
MISSPETWDIKYMSPKIMAYVYSVRSSHLTFLLNTLTVVVLLLSGEPYIPSYMAFVPATWLAIVSAGE